VTETRLHGLQTKDCNKCSNKNDALTISRLWIHSRQCEWYVSRVLAGEYCLEYSLRVLASPNTSEGRG